MVRVFSGAGDSYSIRGPGRSNAAALAHTGGTKHVKTDPMPNAPRHHPPLAPLVVSCWMQATAANAAWKNAWLPVGYHHQPGAWAGLRRSNVHRIIEDTPIYRQIPLKVDRFSRRTERTWSGSCRTGQVDEAICRFPVVYETSAHISLRSRLPLRTARTGLPIFPDWCNRVLAPGGIAEHRPR